MNNIRKLPLPDRLTAEEIHLVIHNVDEKDKLWKLLQGVDFSQAMEVSIKPLARIDPPCRTEWSGSGSGTPRSRDR
jgi:hypothetical protein